jgi:transcription antitermination factor NusG
MTNGVINFVYWDGKPAVIKEKEIAIIKRFLDEHENVEIQSMNLQLNQRVKVTHGPLMDKEGRVVDLRHKIAKVEIESIGYVLIAYIDRTKLTSVQPG